MGRARNRRQPRNAPVLCARPREPLAARREVNTNPNTLVDGTRTCGRAVQGVRAFRERFFGCLKRRSDALFELTDALLTMSTTPSPVHLSLASVHRRGWGSLYAALSKGSLDTEALRDLLAEQQLVDDLGRARVYAQIGDREVLKDYQQVLGSGATIAGPIAETLRRDGLPEEDVEWIKHNFSKTELELGHCLRLP